MVVEIGIGSGLESGRLWAGRKDNWSYYFHIDGVFRFGTFNDLTGKFDGYWDSKKELEKSLKEKFPDVIIKDFTY